MPYKEKEIKKMFYSIGEVAGMFNVKTSHIRFWTKQFSIIKPATNKKGNRLFTAADIENLKVIYHLVKEKGFTLKGAKIEMQAMRKKMRIEQDPKAARRETIAAETTDENKTDDIVSFVPETETEVSSENDFVSNMAYRNSLQKIRAALLQLNNELTLIQQ